MPHIEVHRPRMAFGVHPFAGNSSGHHVARRQLEQRMVALHEALALFVAQVRALAAQRLRNQKTRRAGERKARGMELVELHIGQFSASLRG